MSTRYLFFCVLMGLGLSNYAFEHKDPKTIKQMFYKYDRESIEQRVRERALEIKSYATNNWLDTDYVFLIDYSIPSGFNRLFVYDYLNDTIIYECLVTHGSGYDDSTSTWDGIPYYFSNTENSHLSSLGRYIIKDRGKSGWGVGVNYQLEGIDTTNDQAMQRDIVIHSWELIPDEEVYPLPIKESWGCPAVSNASFNALDGIIYYRPVNMMLYIYN